MSVRLTFEYDGEKPGAPRIVIDAATEDEALKSFLNMQRTKLRKYAQRDWEYTVRSVTPRQRAYCNSHLTAQA